MMKKLSYLIFAYFMVLINSIYSCPFKFINDGRLDIVLVDDNSNGIEKSDESSEENEEKSEDKPFHEITYYVRAGTEVEVPGSLEPDNFVWVYVQDKVGANKFQVKYGILEFECVKEGDPIVRLKFSEFEDMASKKDITESDPQVTGIGFSVETFDSIFNSGFGNFSYVKRDRVFPLEISPLFKLSVPALARLIEQDKLTMERLKEIAPEEVVEKVEEYLKAK